MGVPSVLPLPAAASGQVGCPPCHPWGHLLLLCTALLFLAPAAGTPGLPKAVVSLQPPWLQVFPEDNVTLSCQGAHSPGDNSTQWFHDGTAIPTQVQPSYSFRASSNHSGDYRCQTGQTSLSDPVHLDVTSAWLLLQTPRLLVPQGSPIVLRCHSWKNWRLYKIQFFQDGRPKWFSYTNASFSIPHANASHSGAYHCSGLLGQMQHTSQPVNITVPVSSKAFPPVITAVVAGVAGIVAVAGVAGVVAWVCFRRHQSSGTPENGERGETLPEEPASIAKDTDTAAKAEVENTITYSLLLHPEAPEEDAAPSDYQNM
ncbi:low affinity immunoglobulin gamma Fc region receptor II-b isoform X1 [Myotis daubentonii]|uniref:low affinity immunoglobulin gamma Fc region receptor II-b isoform X1 n=1 Tax=Myotis daubentonii TaxID=98922 RepID=UPI00287375D9|nr:low affinity immunoglobulin gamma Fc region receptor II-b isoform X1 [Myotis daubentonii]